MERSTNLVEKASEVFCFQSAFPSLRVPLVAVAPFGVLVLFWIVRPPKSRGSDREALEGSSVSRLLVLSIEVKD